MSSVFCETRIANQHGKLRLSKTVFIYRRDSELCISGDGGFSSRWFVSCNEQSHSRIYGSDIVVGNIEWLLWVYYLYLLIISSAAKSTEALKNDAFLLSSLINWLDDLWTREPEIFEVFLKNIRILEVVWVNCQEEVLSTFISL